MGVLSTSTSVGLGLLGRRLTRVRIVTTDVVAAHGRVTAPLSGTLVCRASVTRGASRGTSGSPPVPVRRRVESGLRPSRSSVTAVPVGMLGVAGVVVSMVLSRPLLSRLPIGG